jgi:glycerophosphoryl diester phosphodiesterase
MLKIGHRGAAGWEPQNTMSSFRKAVELGCDYIETDIHLCRSGELVLIHDARIDAVSDGSGLVGDMSLAELRAFDFGKGQTLVTLEELFQEVSGRARLNLELKGPDTGAAAAESVQKELAKGTWREEELLVTSFRHSELDRFHQLLPSVPIGVLIKAVLLDTTGYLKRFSPSFLVTSHEFLQKMLVDEVHEAGYRLLIYTVDHPGDIERMYRLGVDGIISNFPDRIAAYEAAVPQ